MTKRRREEKMRDVGHQTGPGESSGDEYRGYYRRLVREHARRVSGFGSPLRGALEDRGIWWIGRPSVGAGFRQSSTQLHGVSSRGTVSNRAHNLDPYRREKRRLESLGTRACSRYSNGYPLVLV